MAMLGLASELAVPLLDSKSRFFVHFALRTLTPQRASDIG